MGKEIFQFPEGGDGADRNPPRPWMFRHAYIMAAFLSWVIFLTLLATAAYFWRNITFGSMAPASIRTAIGDAVALCAVIGLSGMVSMVVGNGLISIFLSCKLKRAVPYESLIKWIGSSNEKKILNLIRQHELPVYASWRNLEEEVDNLPCRLIPLYLLPIHDKYVRWALSPFQKIYFDQDDLEELFDENLDFLRKARPERLKEYGSLTKETDAKLEILLLKKEKYRGVKGRLVTLQNRNEYYKLQSYVVTKLALTTREEWNGLRQKGKEITHTTIQLRTMQILNENPELQKKILELGVKGSPELPKAMEDFFRNAMPEEMVDWRPSKEKPTLESLIVKYIGTNADETDESASPEMDQS